MKNLSFLLLISIILSSCGGPKKRSGAPQVLVFSKTEGFRHASIPVGIKAIEKLGAENGFDVVATEDASIFTEEDLKGFSAVVFLSTTGNILNTKQETAFERYIQSGGGFVGIHAATDTEYKWPWYGRMVGGYFQSHPHNQDADFHVLDRTHPSTKHLDSIWRRHDELYNFKNLNKDVNVLMTIDESTYEGGENGDHHPMSWYHAYDGGRAWYTAGGHTDESYSEPKFVQHILGGIQYAIGDNLVLNYDNARSTFSPDGDRFTKVPMVQGGLTEPTELTILPNHDILIAQRRGELLHWNARYEELTEVGKLDVYWKTDIPGVNAEEGLMGLQADPNFAENNWIYLFYAPTGDEEINRLSRFKFIDGEFKSDTEQVILDVASDRQICCHTGGSIAFGPDDMLYLSTGDNSTPFDKPGAQFVNNGYAPLNDLPGDEQYDARRSSGNTNDLRGKILRIKVNEDGSYDIPNGNLFPPGTAKTRPEIFTMGHRNPYRISVDKKRGWVYWGDVGPDANEDKMDTRGPRGYDEMNQAREAGNYGWPLFIGNNKPYRDYDYSNGQHGGFFDPMKPINDSKNNTGLTELPPAQPAYMYYPYAESPDFEDVGTGGRNAMAGPTYYKDLYTGENALPDYYDGKVIIYDWMRGWMKALTLDEKGDVVKHEPFAPEVELANLIDMEVGPDGRIYFLEYGTGWFRTNDDSGLSYLEFNGGNRPPVVEPLVASATSGPVPLSVQLDVSSIDREGDGMSYIWHLADGVTKETSEPTIQHTYSTPGMHDVYVEVKDDNGATAQSAMLSIVAGNTTPVVDIELTGGNTSFYTPGQPLQYKVNVSDPEDGTIDPENIYVSVDYMDGYDEVGLNLGHQQASVKATGEMLVGSLDCKSCHKLNEKSIGPSYEDISEKYQDLRKAERYIAEKIIHGGSGVWGDVAMAAHPDLSANEAQSMAIYILSLKGEVTREPSLPIAGTITPEAGSSNKVMVLTASYLDQGSGDIQALTGMKTMKIRNNNVDFGMIDDMEGFQVFDFNDQKLGVLPVSGGWYKLNNVDLTGISSIQINTGWQKAPENTFDIEVRKNAPDGEVIGKGTLIIPNATAPGGMVPIRITKPTGLVDDLYFTYTRNEANPFSGQAALVNMVFE